MLTLFSAQIQRMEDSCGYLLKHTKYLMCWGTALTHCPSYALDGRWLHNLRHSVLCVAHRLYTVLTQSRQPRVFDIFWSICSYFPFSAQIRILTHMVSINIVDTMLDTVKNQLNISMNIVFYFLQQCFNVKIVRKLAV